MSSESMMNVEIEGLEELTVKLSKLKKNIKKEIVNPAVKNIMKKAVKISKNKVPVRTGELRKHIVYRMNHNKDKNIVGASLLVKRNRNLTKKELRDIRYRYKDKDLVGSEVIPIAQSVVKQRVEEAKQENLKRKKDKKIIRPDRVFGEIKLKKQNIYKVKWNDKGKAYIQYYIAHLVEYGSIHNKAKPFIRPALTEAKPIEKLQKAIDDGFKKYGL